MKPLSRRQRSSTDPTAPFTTSFRLDAATHGALAERAAAQNISPHELARRFVQESLQMAPGQPNLPGVTDPAELLLGLQHVYAHLLETRKDIALAVEVLLCRAGQISAAESKAWVRKNYPDACSHSPKE